MYSPKITDIDFVKFAKLTRRLSGKTLQVYSSALDCFRQICQIDSLSDVNIWHRGHFYAAINELPLSQSTKERYCGIVDDLFLWLVKYHDLAIAGCRPPYPAERINPDEVVREEEFQMLLKVAGQKRTGKRDVALLLLMDECGLTDVAASVIRMAAINFTHHTLIAHDERGFPQFMAYSRPETINALKRWQRIRPQSDWLFCTETGSPLSTRAMHAMLRGLVRECKLDKNVKFEGIFYRFAIRELDQVPVELMPLAEALGGTKYSHLYALLAA